jgi:tetratricopeptide (TPR) repeat protein
MSEPSKPTRVSFDELMTKGVFLFYHERERDAVECLRSALQEQPKDLRARYLISLAAQIHGDEATVEQMSMAAQEIDPQNAYALACEAVRFMEYANYSRADQFFEQALLKIPSDVDFWFGRGMLYDYAGEHEKAIGAYLRVITLDPQNVSGHIALGHAYADAGDLEAARPEYEKAKTLDPETDGPRYRIGKDLLYRGSLPVAVQELQLAIEEEPDVPGPYFYLLNALRTSGKTDEAIELYAEIRRRFRDQADATAGFFYQLGAWEDAIRDYRRALAKDPTDAESRFLLAGCYRELGRWEDAIAELRIIVRAEPDNVSARTGLSEALFRAGRYSEAASQARMAIDDDEIMFSAYDILADALVMQGRTDAASQVLADLDRQRESTQADYQRRFFGGAPTPRRRPGQSII